MFAARRNVAARLAVAASTVPPVSRLSVSRAARCRRSGRPAPAAARRRGTPAAMEALVPPADPERSTLEVAESSGLLLHAGVAAKGAERNELEHLARYISCPPIATGRLALTDGGNLRYALKTPYRHLRRAPSGHRQQSPPSSSAFSISSAPAPCPPIPRIRPGRPAGQAAALINPIPRHAPRALPSRWAGLAGVRGSIPRVRVACPPGQFLKGNIEGRRQPAGIPRSHLPHEPPLLPASAPLSRRGMAFECPMLLVQKKDGSLSLRAERFWPLVEMAASEPRLPLIRSPGMGIFLPRFWGFSPIVGKLTAAYHASACKRKTLYGPETFFPKRENKKDVQAHLTHLHRLGL